MNRQSLLFGLGLLAVVIPDFGTTLSQTSSPTASLNLSNNMRERAHAPPTYTSTQTAPATPALSRSSLLSILNRRTSVRPYIERYQQLASDSANTAVSADALKIVPSPDARYPYLGVYHHHLGNDLFEVILAFSTDLSTWHKLGRINSPASMPDIRILTDNSVLVAVEANPTGKRPFIQIFYYRTLTEFMASPDSPTRCADLPQTQGASADGTPNFGTISYDGDILNSSIEISYHYFAGGKKDQKTVGTLRDFSRFLPGSSAWLNIAFEKLGYSNLGDSSFLQVGQDTYMIVEARTSMADGFGAWRLFLVDPEARITPLSPKIPGGAHAIGNPNVSYLTLPDGRPALYFGFFVFSEEAGSTPPGQSVIIYPLTL
jgi:hypothetical protein